MKLFWVCAGGMDCDLLRPLSTSASPWCSGGGEEQDGEKRNECSERCVFVHGQKHHAELTNATAEAI